MLSQDIDFGKKIITEELKKLNLSENIVNSLQEEAFIKLNKMLARWNMNKPFRTNCLTEVDRASIEKIARNVCLEIAGQYEISNELKISKEYICFKDGAFYIGNKSANKKMIDDKYNPDGYNIGMNLGEKAGQSIMHLHVHLIPRYDGDVKNPRGGVRGIISEKQNY